MAPDYDEIDENCCSDMFHSYYLNGDSNLCTVDDLKESLKKCLFDARKKISILRKEVKEKQQSLDKEHDMREQAEKELTLLLRNHHDTIPASSHLPYNRLKLRNQTQQRASPDWCDTSETIVDELKAARMLNRTLTEKLSEVEVELAKMQQSRSDVHMEFEAKVAARGAALVDKIYTAQKSRDAAISNRLKLLIEENEELLLKVKRLEARDNGCDSGVETGSAHGGEIFENKEWNELVNRVMVSTNDHHYGDSCVTNEEFQRLRHERDNLKEQVRRLQNELRDVQFENESDEVQRRKNERAKLKHLQNAVKSTQKQRDDALSKMMSLKDDLEQLKLQRSLNKSLSQEQDLRKQFNSTISEFESKLIERESQLTVTQSSNEELVTKLRNSIREKKALSEQLKDTLEQANEDKIRVDKMERLVDVLRKRKKISIAETLA